MTNLMGFEFSLDDVQHVLQANSQRVVRTWVPVETLAAQVIGEIDAVRVEKAALDAGDDLSEQTTAAHAEIRRILVEIGVLALWQWDKEAAA